MDIITTSRVTIENDDRSAIHTHLKDQEDPAYAICHHSGQYLKKSEMNPAPIHFFREQHDFPGFPKLDRAFQSAAHAPAHQHWLWSEPAIKASGMLVSSAIILTMVYLLAKYRDFVYAGFWDLAFVTTLTLSGLASLVLIVYALYLISERENIYHKGASGEPPGVPDFPLECGYEIAMEEIISVAFDNNYHQPPEVKEQNCHIAVTVYPTNNDRKTYAAYRKQYHAFPEAGRFVHAGVIGFENVNGIQLLERTFEYDHRLVLKVPVEETQILQPDSNHKLASFSVSANYVLENSLLYPTRYGFPQFPFDFYPRIDPEDGRTLEIHFVWHGNTASPVLKECILENIPPSLDTVVNVDFGRFERHYDTPRVVWRHRTFRNRKLVLRVTFKAPILNCQELIIGKLCIAAEGLISNLSLNTEDHVWTAQGLPAKKSRVRVRKETKIFGEFKLNLQQLSQEHELNPSLQPIEIDVPPSEHVVHAIVNVLLESGFDMQRIIQDAPRLNPSGKINSQLFYWDILGRYYLPQSLNAVDAHVVVSGFDVQETRPEIKGLYPFTKIELHLRSLYDPRTQETKQAVLSILGEHRPDPLRQKLIERIKENCKTN